jgi:hypothetical protein
VRQNAGLDGCAGNPERSRLCPWFPERENRELIRSNRDKYLQTSVCFADLAAASRCGLRAPNIAFAIGGNVVRIFLSDSYTAQIKIK